MLLWVSTHFYTIPCRGVGRAYIARGYINQMTSVNGSLGHSDAHSCTKRQANVAIVGKASPQASTQEALWFLVVTPAVVAAAHLVYRRP